MVNQHQLTHVHETVIHLGTRDIDGGRLNGGCSDVAQNGFGQCWVDWHGI